jgi:Recombination endonuclease VII
VTKGLLTDAQPRKCVICGETFTPHRRKQEACPPSTGRNCAVTLSNSRRGGTRDASGMFTDLIPDPRPCEKCGRVFQPKRRDAKTCGANCQGKPDFTLTCASPSCGKEFTVKGNSQGKGNQQYCSELCRDRESQWRLRSRFRRYNGMTPEEFRFRADAQDGCCKICGRRPTPDKRRVITQDLPYLVVDHDHASGQVRDLLCGPCNTAIGLLGDDPDRAIAAAAYLRGWAAKLADCAPCPDRPG